MQTPMPRMPTHSQGLVSACPRAIQTAARALEFERAAELRDQIKRLKKLVIFEV